MESARRSITNARRVSSGLANCVEKELNGSGLTDWKSAKERGARLFKPEHGGSYQVFEQRPIPNDIISYCVGDVQYLPVLRQKFRSQASLQDLVREETKKRVEESQKLDYQPHGTSHALSPWNAAQNRTTKEENSDPPEDEYDSCDDRTRASDCIDNSDHHFYYDD